MNSIKPTTQQSYNGEATRNRPPLDSSILLDNASICQRSKQLRYIVYVHSAPENAERRRILRSTWLNGTLFSEQIIATVFIMGRSERQSVNENVKAEALTHRDIIQGDFTDSYKNLTLKAVMGLKWIATRCWWVRFAIKVDDDTFVNVFSLTNTLQLYEGRRKTILCRIWEDNLMPILRDPDMCMKWCVKEDEFPGRQAYPRYCAGLAFVISGDLIPLLYTTSRTTPFFWIDDVYVTGLLPGKLHDVQYVNIIEQIVERTQISTNDLFNPRTPLTYLILHLPDKEDFLRLWPFFREITNQIVLNATALLL
jgi:hypothetical protein